MLWKEIRGLELGSNYITAVVIAPLIMLIMTSTMIILYVHAAGGMIMVCSPLPVSVTRS